MLELSDESRLTVLKLLRVNVVGSIVVNGVNFDRNFRVRKPMSALSDN